MDCTEEAQQQLQKLTIQEKATLCSGADFWHLHGIDRLDLPSIMVTDGPHGLRKQPDNADHLGIADSQPATCFPTASGLAASWNRELGGYDTSPEGEMKAAAFQAGFTRDDDDFFTALFAILIHTAGINMAPFPMPVLLGRIGQQGLAMEVLRALQRGAAMKVDLGRDWNFWKYVELPIEVARERLGVPPLDAGTVGA